MSFASDASAQSAATNAAKAASRTLSQAGRAPKGNDKASGSFDDILSTMPDNKPEPRAQRREDAPAERPQAAARNDRPAKADRPAPADRKAAKADDKPAPAADDAPVKDAAAPETDKAVTETKPAGDETTAKTDSAEKPADETKGTDTDATTKAAVDALIPQAVVIDPAAVTAAADITAAGDKNAKAQIAAVAADAANAQANAEQAAQAAQPQNLTAEDEQALSALAAKAMQGLKDAHGEKAAKKSDNDKTAHAAKVTGDAADAEATAQVQATSTPSEKPADKAVQSDLTKVAAEHQRGAGDTDAKPADNTALTAAGNTVTAKADAQPQQTFAATLHQTQMAGGGANGPAQTANSDKPVALANVAVEVSSRIASGKNQFDIRLSPEDLGHIHVKVNVDRDGNITTHMMADRPETLDLLRRDIQGLERSLQDVGLKTSENSLQFSLRDQSANQQQAHQDTSNGHAARVTAEDEQPINTPVTLMARDYGRYGVRLSGLDIRV